VDCGPRFDNSIKRGQPAEFSLNGVVLDGQK
jgi:FKBP-type peptidyl-prolyl cis-trans isomerase